MREDKITSKDGVTLTFMIPETEEDYKKIAEMEAKGEIDTNASFGDYRNAAKKRAAQQGQAPSAQQPQAAPAQQKPASPPVPPQTQASNLTWVRKNCKFGKDQ